MTRIIEDLRILGLFNAGALELSLASVDLSDVARDVTALCAAELKDRGIAGSPMLTPVRVWDDPAQMRQVLVEPIENAKRYAPGAPLKIDTQVNGSGVLPR